MVALVMQRNFSPELAMLSVLVFVVVLLFQVQHIERKRLALAVAFILVAVGCSLYAEDIVQPHPCWNLTEADWMYWAIGCWLFPPP